MDSEYLEYMFGGSVPEGGLGEAQTEAEVIKAFADVGIDLSGLSEAEVDHLLATLPEHLQTLIPRSAA